MVSQWSEELRTKSVVISGHGDAKFSVGLGAGAGRDGLVVRHRVLNYRRYCGRLHSRWRRRGRWRWDRRWDRSALGSGIDGIGAGGSRRQWWDRDQVDIRLDITCRQTAKCAPRVAQHKRAVSTALVTALVTTSTTDHTTDSTTQRYSTRPTTLATFNEYRPAPACH